MSELDMGDFVSVVPGPVLSGSSPKADWRDVTLAWLDRWHRLSLWLCVGLSVLIGVVYSIHLGATLRYVDEQRYVSIANNLVHHGTFSVAQQGNVTLQAGVHATAYEAPGWPLLVALMRLLGGSILDFRLANVALAALSVAIGWWIARALGGNAVAALAAPMLALYPIAIYVEGTLYPETLGCALLLAGLAATIQARTSAKPFWWATAAGASFGYLILTIPNAWIPLAAALAWLALGRRRLWRVASCVFIVALLVVSVWVVRNEATMHQFIPVTDASGINLLQANSEHASVRAGVATNTSGYVAEAARQGKTSEVALESFYRTQALDWIRSHPARALQLYVERVADYFAPYDSVATKSQQSKSENALAIVFYLPLLILLLIRLLRWRSDQPESIERLLIWIYLLNAPVAALFVTRVRYRVPFDELLIIIAASTLVSLLVRRRQDRILEVATQDYKEVN
jgi:4-amino-4-deoxy-L-arabinose transferase-like glycosyltransferase